MEVEMGVFDIILMVLIFSGAAYMLYRTLFKKKGHCAGCSSASACETRK